MVTGHSGQGGQHVHVIVAEGYRLASGHVHNLDQAEEDIHVLEKRKETKNGESATHINVKVSLGRNMFCFPSFMHKRYSNSSIYFSHFHELILPYLI